MGRQGPQRQQKRTAEITSPLQICWLEAGHWDLLPVSKACSVAAEGAKEETSDSVPRASVMSQSVSVCGPPLKTDKGETEREKDRQREGNESQRQTGRVTQNVRYGSRENSTVK